MSNPSGPRREGFWPRAVVQKWFNIKDSDFSADPEDEDDCDPDSDCEEEFIWRGRGRQSQYDNSMDDEVHLGCDDFLPRVTRRNSETFRAQYMNTKELKICVGTWNAGGKTPPEDLVLDEWLDTNNPCDIYVFGFQEVVPLNAGNIFGAEDHRAIPKWESIIRETLLRVRRSKTRCKCHTDPPSPSRFKPVDDSPYVENETLLDTDSDEDEEVLPLNEEFEQTAENVFTDSGASGNSREQALRLEDGNPKRLDRLNCLRAETCEESLKASLVTHPKCLLTRKPSRGRIGLGRPEPPLYLLGHRSVGRPISFTSSKSLNSSKSFGRSNSLRARSNDGSRDLSAIRMIAELDIESLMKRERRSTYVRIVSKQMVGIFLTIWVRRSLRQHVQNLRVSTAGVGVMGYIGNKGSVSVSMSVYQTSFCFVCSHLTSGEKEGDENKRNADVHEIHKKTCFRSISNIGLPRSIHDHERIIWLGDLNYRIKLSYEKTQELISKREWARMLEMDQLVGELRKGRTFDGWCEGVLNFAPTYKYEHNSDKYCGENPKSGRRTPSWCDRVLSYGKGLRVVSYRRSELRVSDHRPVTATFVVEVEEFSSRKLQRALTLTDAEIESEEFGLTSQ